MSGSDSNERVNGVRRLISQFENLGNAQDTRKPQVGARLIPISIKRVSRDTNQVRRPLGKEKPSQCNKMTIPSNTSQSIKEVPSNTKTGYDDENADTSKTEREEEKTNFENENADTSKTEKQEEENHLLEESAKEQTAYSTKQVTVAEIPNDANEKKELGNVKVNQFKMMDILKELIETEEQYIAGLKLISDEYIPHTIKHSPQGLSKSFPLTFKYIEQICKNSQTFLMCLKDISATADDIAGIFIKKATDFELYSFYPIHLPMARLYLKQFDDILQLKDLSDKLEIHFLLLSPIRRIRKYFLILKEIQNELGKSETSSQRLEDAISLVSKIKKNGSDYVVIDSIKYSELDFIQHGSFVTKRLFSIVKPKRFQSMVFLFQKVVVFTESIAKSSESFTYVDSILTNDLRLEQFDKKPTVFKLTSHSKFKMGAPDATYVLEADSTNTKDEWIRAINGILWEQLKNKKAQVLRSQSCFPQVNR